MAKLTLSVDDRVISRAKEYAEQRGVSISKMVESYLTALAAPPASLHEGSPVLESVRGILREADMESYRQHLSDKYR